jgi:hypothetical protein
LSRNEKSVNDLRKGVGSGNNYAYLVVDEASKDAVIIDPAHPPEYVRARDLPQFDGMTFDIC